MKKNYILTGILIASFLMFCNIFINAQNIHPKNSDCDLFENFEESIWNGTGYALRTVTDNLGTWSVAGVCITTDVNDRKHGDRSIRLRGNSGDNCYVQMDFDKTDGIGVVSFAYASYSNHSNGIIVLYYSTDQGTTWVLGGSVTAPAWGGEMLSGSFSINMLGNARIKIVREGSLANSTSVNIDDICITDFTNPNIVATPTFTPQSGNYLTPQLVTISCATEGSNIHYTTDGTTPTTSSPTFSTPIEVSITTTIKALAAKVGMDNSAVATSTYSFPVEVLNIAAFKAANHATSSIIYKIIGDVTFLFRNGSNIYIQDETAGLNIYDNSSIITNEYENGDIISGGILGSCTMYNGLHEFIPAANFPAGTSGTPVQPTIVSMQHLIDNFMDYESRLIRLIGVEFDAGTFGTGAAGNINIYQGQSFMVCRNHFNTITGYVTDPDKLYDVVGFAIPYVTSSANDKQIAPRGLADIFLNVPGFIITATAGNGGKIEPSGTVFVAEGEDITFTITPNYGYEIESVFLDGVSVGQPETVTLTHITGDHTISVTFTAIDIVAKPVFSPAPGSYNTEIDVIITCETEGAEIFYTTIGSEPTQLDTKYTQPIMLDKGTHTIKAKAFKTDVLPSETVDAIYNITLSINENELDKLISIYPNPTTGELTITNYELVITNVEIYDVYGRKVGIQFPYVIKNAMRNLEDYGTQADGVVINFSNLQQGIYFIKIDTDKGNIIKKVIKT
jgi:hypothetical protein